MTRTPNPSRPRTARYRKARIRNFMFTVGPDRLSGGRIGRRHVARDLAVREIEIASPHWPEAFDGLRIGHVSDFHVGPLIPVARAVEALDLLDALEPDLVACTGDVVDLHHHDGPPVLERLGAMMAPMGAVLVLGNHDELHCPQTLMRAARAVGVTVLEDDAACFNCAGEELIVAGIGWSKSADGCALKVDAVGAGDAHVLLAHNPKAFVRAAALGVPLTLSGHTHGGQVAMKNRPNANLALGHRHRAGVFESGPSRLFVTTGVGSWFPLRVNCPAEVAVITMRTSRRYEAPVEPDRPRRGRKKRG